MNKQLSKDQWQKIILSCLLMLGLIYCYFTFLITPMGKTDTTNLAAIETLDGQLAQARTQEMRSRTIEAQARNAEETLAQVNDMIPEGEPIAWFPPKMHDFLERQNLKNAVVRPAGAASSENGMGDLKSENWVIDVPQSGFVQLGIALAGLENEEKLLQITHLQITNQVDNPEKQHVTISVVALEK
jgi:hypothetical protein